MFFVFVVLFLAIVCYSQSGDDPQEDWVIAKFGYKLNMKKKVLKHPSIIFGYLLEPCIEIWWFFLNFGRIRATENFKMCVILAFSIVNIVCILAIYMASKKKGLH
jgi:hypothetical protein